jgi:hypothetical protein
VAPDRGVEPGLALVEAEAVFAEPEILFYQPSEPCGADQPGLGQDLPVRHRRDGVSDRVIEQPLGLIRRPIPACRAMLHPFTSGSSLITAAAYLPACSHGSVLAKHGRSSPSSSARFRSASPAPMLTAAAASVLCTRHRHDHEAVALTPAHAVTRSHQPRGHLRPAHTTKCGCCTSPLQARWDAPTS